MYVVELTPGQWLTGTSSTTHVRKNAKQYTTQAEAAADLKAFTGTGKTKAKIKKA